MKKVLGLQKKSVLDERYANAFSCTSCESGSC